MRTILIRNIIVSIHSSRGIIESVKEVKMEVKKLFKEIFQESNFSRSVLDGMEFKQLSVEDRVRLKESFSYDEIKEVVCSSDVNKSLGSDEINFGFLKTCKEFMKDDIVNFLNDFHYNVVHPKAITTSFLSFVPSSNNPWKLDEYRTIFLIGSLYKILAKVLASTSKRVVGKLISSCQTAFVSGKQILDDFLVVKE